MQEENIASSNQGNEGKGEVWNRIVLKKKERRKENREVRRKETQREEGREKKPPCDEKLISEN